MKRFVRMMVLDLREMSFGRFFPTVSVVLLTVFAAVSFIGTPFPEMDAQSRIYMFQRLAPVFSAWWVIMLFHSCVEDDGAEAFYSYCYSRKILGIGRIAALTVIFVALLMLSGIAFLSVGIIRFDQLLPFVLILSVQSLFFESAGYLIIMAVRNMLWSFSAILLLSYINIWGFPGIGQYLNIEIDISGGMGLGQILPKLTVIAVLSAILAVIAQRLFDNYRFRPMKKK